MASTQNSLFVIIYYIVFPLSFILALIFAFSITVVFTNDWLFCKEGKRIRLRKYPALCVVMFGLYFLFLSFVMVYFDILKTQMAISSTLSIYHIVFFGIHILYISIAIPYCIFHEARFDKHENRFKNICCQNCCGFIAFMFFNLIYWALICFLYFYYHESRIPFLDFQQSQYASSLSEITSNPSKFFTTSSYKTDLLSLKMSPHIVCFIIGLNMLLSWVIFILFAGIGMCGLPISICWGMSKFCKFLKWGKGLNKLGKNEFLIQRKYLKMKTEELLCRGIRLKEKGTGEKKTLRMNQVWNFKRAVEDMELRGDEIEHRFLGGDSILLTICSMFVAPITFFFATIWLFHILTSTFLKERFALYYSGLSTLFTIFDFTRLYIKAPIIGYICYLLMMIYLFMSLCFGLKTVLKVIDGVFFCVKLPKLKFQGTGTYHFLLYVSVFTWGLYAVLDVVANSFEEYSNQTYFNTLFRNVVHYLQFWEWIFAVCPTIFCLFTCICCCFQCVYFWRKTDKRLERLEDFQEFSREEKSRKTD